MSHISWRCLHSTIVKKPAMSSRAILITKTVAAPFQLAFITQFFLLVLLIIKVRQTNDAVDTHRDHSDST